MEYLYHVEKLYREKKDLQNSYTSKTFIKTVPRPKHFVKVASEVSVGGWMDMGGDDKIKLGKVPNLG